ncbi:uncharacterized protein LTR77_004462 [Saxophila tyrrhenica]|uniref:F-box domain-containing protein n=1 Tax=Saxophila tyrrhenica TaxID=1690608 RepID=A0AAV9PDY6_9PEZI|nr:hypothetical protein LTR77_004462 [Saxophila tyrrhenica]
MGAGNSKIPLEVANLIANYVFGFLMAPPPQALQSNVQIYTPPPYLTPPKTCLLMEIPTEIRLQIFKDLLPSRDTVHDVSCSDDAVAATKKTSYLRRPGLTLGLMLLNRKIASEVAQVVYGERFFVVHAHEGLHKGGIEFLHAGRQPLHFREFDRHDERFDFRFKGGDFGYEFSFDRLKKVIIKIYPAPAGDSGRHTPINTFLMNLALCRLLARNPTSNGVEQRIVNITIVFMNPKGVLEKSGRRAIQHAENYWWDSEKGQPRTTSHYGIPNIELVLRPFATLTGCHNVEVRLPERVRDHLMTCSFVDELATSMMSPERTLGRDDQLDGKIEAARHAMEEYIRYFSKGKKPGPDVGRMKPEEVLEDDEQYYDEDDEEPDSVRRSQGPGQMTTSHKGRRTGRVDHEEEELQQAMRASLVTMASERPTDFSTNFDEDDEDEDHTMTDPSAPLGDLDDEDESGNTFVAVCQVGDWRRFKPVETSPVRSTAIAQLLNAPSTHMFEASHVEELTSAISYISRTMTAARTFQPSPGAVRSNNLPGPMRSLGTSAEHDRPSPGPTDGDGDASPTDTNDFETSPRKRRALTTQAGNAATPRTSSLPPPAASAAPAEQESAVRHVAVTEPAAAAFDGDKMEVDLMDFAEG